MDTNEFQYLIPDFCIQSTSSKGVYEHELLVWVCKCGCGCVCAREREKERNRQRKRKRRGRLHVLVVLCMFCLPFFISHQGSKNEGALFIVLPPVPETENVLDRCQSCWVTANCHLHLKIDLPPHPLQPLTHKRMSFSKHYLFTRKACMDIFFLLKYNADFSELMWSLFTLFGK